MTKIPKRLVRAIRRSSSTSLTRRQRLGLWGPVMASMTLIMGTLGTASASSKFFQVGAAPSETDLSSSANPSVIGQPVTYNVKVTDDPSDSTIGIGIPSGTVDVLDGTTVICDNVALSATGEATCAVAFTSAANHSITAKYSGDSNYATSTSSALIQDVNKAATSTALSSSDGDNKTVSGQAVTYTAHLTVVAPGSGTPTGTVAFKDGANTISGCGTKSLSSGIATCLTNFTVGTGTHTVTAKYSGDSKYAASTSSSIIQTVSKATTHTALTSSKNPAHSSDTVTYSAVVTVPAPGSGPAQGRVVFTDGGKAISACNGTTGQALNSSGLAKCSVSYARVGTHSISSRYLGNSNFNGSTSNSISQVFTYLIKAYISKGTNGDPLQASFRLSGNPETSYRLCIKFDDAWPARTPPPANGATPYSLNLNYKCKSISWSSGHRSIRKLGYDYGFATKGTYRAVWYVNGSQLGSDTVEWDSWCPPGPLSFRQIGVWRPSRHKVIDSCRTSSGELTKYGTISKLDGDKGWQFGGSVGSVHVEYVPRDRLKSYGAPSTDSLGNSGPGWIGKEWTLTGVLLCDTFHGWKEFHPVFRATHDNDTFISGAQYGTKSPSISGSWSAHAC